MALGNLTKAERRDFETRKLLASNKRQELQAAILDFNLRIEALYAEMVSPVVAEYNEATQRVNQFVEDIVSDQTEKFDNRSEKWRDGEAGCKVAEWIGEWEFASLDPVPDFEVEIPSIEAPDDSQSEAELISNLTLSVDGE